MIRPLIRLVALSAMTLWCYVPVMSQDLSFTTGADGNKQVVLGDEFYRGNVEVPEQVEGVPVTAVGRAAFNACRGLKSVSLPASLKLIDDYAFNACDTLGNVTIPDGVTRIGDHAFHACGMMTSITVPDAVTSIGSFAFFGCKRLTDVTIGSGVTSIGERAFQSCKALKTITVSPDNTAYCDIDGVLYTSDCQTLVSYPRKQESWRDYVVPNGTKHISPYAFWYCDAMKTITLNADLETIGEWAFANCTVIKEIVLPPTITAIGANAFKGCKALKQVHNQAEIPLQLNPYSTPFGMFTDLSLATLYVPAGTVPAYSESPVWKDFGTIVEDVSAAVMVESANVRAYALGLTLCIEGVLPGQSVQVYNVAGSLIYSGRERTIAMPAAGVYVVRVGDKAFKILAK